MQVLIEYLHDQHTPETKAQPQNAVVPAIVPAAA